MHIAPVNSRPQVQTPASLLSGGASTGPRDQAAVKAAGQFEAIILRQLLEPVVKPILSGGMGGGGPWAGVYGYLLTDTLANSLTAGGGLGLARILETQLAPKAPAGGATDTSSSLP
jgi:peptidoglycan hydrolase FlgJ